MMRMCQELESEGNPHQRAAFSCYELAYALYNWRRQLQNHCSFYRQLPATPPDDKGCGSHGVHKPNFEQALSVQDFTERILLDSQRCVGKVSTPTCRTRMKNRLVARGANVQREVSRAVRRLANCRIVRIVDSFFHRKELVE